MRIFTERNIQDCFSLVACPGLELAERDALKQWMIPEGPITQSDGLAAEALSSMLSAQADQTPYGNLAWAAVRRFVKLTVARGYSETALGSLKEVMKGGGYFSALEQLYQDFELIPSKSSSPPVCDNTANEKDVHWRAVCESMRQSPLRHVAMGRFGFIFLSLEKVFEGDVQSPKGFASHNDVYEMIDRLNELEIPPQKRRAGDGLLREKWAAGKSVRDVATDIDGSVHTGCIQDPKLALKISALSQSVYVTQSYQSFGDLATKLAEEWAVSFDKNKKLEIDDLVNVFKCCLDELRDLPDFLEELCQFAISLNKQNRIHLKPSLDHIRHTVDEDHSVYVSTQNEIYVRDIPSQASRMSTTALKNSFLARLKSLVRTIEKCRRLAHPDRSETLVVHPPRIRRIVNQAHIRAVGTYVDIALGDHTLVEKIGYMGLGLGEYCCMQWPR